LRQFWRPVGDSDNSSLLKAKTKQRNYVFLLWTEPIEIVETYIKYLGILFHYSGKFSQAMSNLADKARKTYFALKSKIPYSDNLSIKS
jgi:hypothetical protein